MLIKMDKREENLKKINADEKILKNEQLSDEDLDNIAGGKGGRLSSALEDFGEKIIKLFR